MSLQDKIRPIFKAPALSCDCHFHVFGSAEQYPYDDSDELRYTPPFAPLDAYFTLAHRLGIERYVFVQPSAYCRDNTCMIDAMDKVNAKYGPICRGIVDVDEDIPDTELERLHAIGVRGVRINVSPIKPHETGFADKLLTRIKLLDTRLSKIGWQLEFLLPGWLTSELMSTLEKLKANFTLAHMGLFLAKEGPKQPGFLQLIDLLQNGNGRCWVKFSGVYRISTAADFADAAPMAQALIEAAPDRIIWGSDYPHLHFTNKVDSVELFNLLRQWVPDDATLRQILVKNPQNLFGF